MKEVRTIAAIFIGSILLLAGTSVYASHRHPAISFSESQNQALVSEAVFATTTAQIALQPGSVDVPIFIYHSVRPPYEGETQDVKQYTVSPENLDAQLKSLKDAGYVVISLDRFVDRLKNGTPIPARSAVLTFDDGWENQIVYALPILKKYQDTATFFVYTHALGRTNFMTWDDLKTLDTAGMSIGDHTETHPYLFKITDPKQMEKEIMGSKKRLEDFLGKPVTQFAYPFGHGNGLALDTIIKAGFLSARTTYPALHNSKDDLYNLNAYLVQDTPDFAKKLIGMMEK